LAATQPSLEALSPG